MFRLIVSLSNELVALTVSDIPILSCEVLDCWASIGGTLKTMIEMIIETISCIFF